MNILSLDIPGVAEDKAYKIIYTALTSKSISRGEIASICSVSTVTVGKVVSELLSAGLLIATKVPRGAGPHTEMLCPSPKINTLFFDLGERRIKLTVCNAAKEVVTERSTEINDALPYEANVINFVTAIVRSLPDPIAQGICVYAAAFRQKSCKSAIDTAHSDGALAEFYAVRSYDDYVCDIIKKQYPDKFIFLVHIGDNISLSIIHEGRRIDTYNPIVDHISPLDIKGAIVDIANALAPIIRTIRTDMIILESDTMPIDRRFTEALGSKITELTQGKQTVDVVSGEELYLAARSATYITAEKLARELSKKKKS